MTPFTPYYFLTLGLQMQQQQHFDQPCMVDCRLRLATGSHHTLLHTRQHLHAHSSIPNATNASSCSFCICCCSRPSCSSHSPSGWEWGRGRWWGQAASDEEQCLCHPLSFREPSEGHEARQQVLQVPHS
jgi:hypothetical protein